MTVQELINFCKVGINDQSSNPRFSNAEWFKWLDGGQKLTAMLTKLFGVHDAEDIVVDGSKTFYSYPAGSINYFTVDAIYYEGLPLQKTGMEQLDREYPGWRMELVAITGVPKFWFPAPIVLETVGETTISVKGFGVYPKAPTDAEKPLKFFGYRYPTSINALSSLVEIPEPHDLLLVSYACWMASLSDRANEEMNLRAPELLAKFTSGIMLLAEEYSSSESLEMVKRYVDQIRPTQAGMG